MIEEEEGHDEEEIYIYKKNASLSVGRKFSCEKNYLLIKQKRQGREEMFFFRPRLEKEFFCTYPNVEDEQQMEGRQSVNSKLEYHNFDLLQHPPPAPLYLSTTLHKLPSPPFDFQEEEEGETECESPLLPKEAKYRGKDEQEKNVPTNETGGGGDIGGTGVKSASDTSTTSTLNFNPTTHIPIETNDDFDINDNNNNNKNHYINKLHLFELPAPHPSSITLSSTNSPLHRYRSSLSPFGGESERTARENQRFMIIAFAIKASILLVLVGSGYLIYRNQEALGQVLEQFLTFVAHLGLFGPLVYTLAYTLLCSLFFPGEILTLSAGFVLTQEDTFGFKLGYPIAVCCVFIGQTASCVINFFVCRLWLFESTQLMFRRFKLLRAFTRAVKEGGGKFVMLIRLSPLIPFSFSNCLLGVTEIPFSSVLFGMIGTLPLNAVTVYLGSAVGDIEDLKHPEWHWDVEHIIVGTVGVTAAACGLGYIVWLTRKKLDDALIEDRDDLMYQRSLTIPIG